MRQVVCRAEELSPGDMVSARLGPMPIVVVRTPDGSVYGLLDKCLHQGGPLSQGRLLGKTCSSGEVGDYREERDGEILRCPWHGYEYDVKTGCTVFDPSRRLRTFKVSEENGEIVAET